MAPQNCILKLIMHTLFCKYPGSDSAKNRYKLPSRVTSISFVVTCGATQHAHQFNFRMTIAGASFISTSTPMFILLCILLVLLLVYAVKAQSNQRCLMYKSPFAIASEHALL
eukprot:6208216-Pleurochrysis_carterae.AAC.1